MKITLLFTGKTKPHYLKQGITDYVQRIKHYTSLKIIEIQDLKKTRGMPQQKIMEHEADRIMKHIQAEDFVILLDERGKQFSSIELAGWFEDKLLLLSKNIVFVTGGAYGFGGKMYDRADMLVSLSTLTFSHQLVRILFLEQLYRAFTLIKGQPYHHG
jgi:23S rRNA (pseudouridine1915-N3)-methyltransferase